MKKSSEKIAQSMSKPKQERPKGWWRKVVQSLAPGMVHTKPRPSRSIYRGDLHKYLRTSPVSTRPTHSDGRTNNERVIAGRAARMRISVSAYKARFPKGG